MKQSVATSEGQIDPAIGRSHHRGSRDDIVAGLVFPKDLATRGTQAVEEEIMAPDKNAVWLSPLRERVDAALDLALRFKTPGFPAIGNAEGVNEAVGVAKKDPLPKDRGRSDDRPLGFEGPDGSTRFQVDRVKVPVLATDKNTTS